jgi:hypothetical protein
LSVECLEERALLSFAAPVALDLGAAPNAVAVGHFEGARAPLDVVTANANGTVSVLLGNGDGTVQNPITLTVGGTADAVAVGDFLGNGRDDIAAANTDGTVSMLLSNGNGTFQAPERLAVGARPEAIAVGDFNGDGRPDIVTANGNGTVTVLPGNGDGTFGAPITSAVGGSLLAVAVEDFNHDGTPDLAVGGTGGLSVLRGNGDGTLQVTATFVFFADPQEPDIGTVAVTSVEVGAFRTNGPQDIVANASLLRGNGDGTFQDPVRLNFGFFTPASLVVGDFNGDGNLDLAGSNGSSFSGSPSITLLAGKGDGTFQAPRTVNVGGAANALVAGDFRGTGTLDLVLASATNNTVSLVPGNGDGTFATTPIVASYNFPRSIASGVFTSSGKPDLVTAGVGNAMVLLNNGDGTFRTGPTLPLSTVSSAVLVGAFTGDGNQDIAIATSVQAHGTVNVYLGNGDGTFQAPVGFDLGFSNFPLDLVAGDFNGDGNLDIAVLYTRSSGVPKFVKVLLGNGDGTFQDAQTVQVPDDAFTLTAGHFHGANVLDLVTTGTRGSVTVLPGNGDGTFGDPTTTNLGQDVRGAAVGDINRDGKDDLVLTTLGHLGAPSDVIVLPGNGDGTFGQPHVFEFHHSLQGLGGPAVADFFGDGKLGVAITSGDGSATVLRGNGDGTFQAPVNYLITGHDTLPPSLVVADFNGDGKPDLAVTGGQADDVSVLLNTSPAPSNADPVATATTLTTDVSSSVTGQPVTLTATVTSASGTPVGSVTFFDGTTALGVVALDPNGQARLVLPLGVGVHSLTASFAGIAPFTASTAAAVSETVNPAATTTALSAEVFAASFVQFTATVVPVAPGAGAPTGTVTLFDGNTVVGTATLDAFGQAFMDVEGLPPGRHTFTASYGGDGSFQASLSDPLVLIL